MLGTGTRRYSTSYYACGTRTRTRTGTNSVRFLKKTQTIVLRNVTGGGSKPFWACD